MGTESENQMSYEQMCALVRARLYNGLVVACVLGPGDLLLRYMGLMKEAPSAIIHAAFLFLFAHILHRTLVFSYRVLDLEGYVLWYMYTAIGAVLVAVVSALFLGISKAGFFAMCLYGLYCFLHSQLEKKNKNWYDWGKWISEHWYHQARWVAGAAALFLWTHHVTFNVLFGF